MKHPHLFAIALLLSATSHTFAQSDNQKDFAKAQSCYAEGQFGKARSICANILATGDIKYTARCQALLTSINRTEKEQKKLSELPRNRVPDYISVPSIVYLPYGTNSQNVSVKASGAWKADCKDAWIKTKTSKRNLIITATEQNTTTKKKQSAITVECGEITRLITVEQEGMPELLEYQSKYLKVPYTGGQFIVDIKTNTKWKVDYADWYKAIPLDNDSSRMAITIDKNTKNEDRHGSIVVRSESGESYDHLEVYQYANESRIFTAIDSIIQVGVQGDTLLIPIVSDNPSWTPSDCPSWCKESKVGNDTLQVIVVANENYLIREGFVNIKSNDRVSSVWVRQEAQAIPDIARKKVLGGRNISLGVTAGYEFPFVGTSASSPYCGSLLNYSLGNQTENADYDSQVGFHVGALVDMRLYKNMYLLTGLDYRYMKYCNSFSGDVTRYYNQLLNSVYVGTFQNSFSENYKFHMIEIPVLASYRLVLTDKQNLQLNLGPVISIAAGGALSFSGNSDSESVYQHSIIYNKVGPVIGNVSQEHMKYAGDMNLFSNSINCTVTKSTGMNVGQESSYTTAAAPYKRINLGIRAGLTYEYAGLQFALSYTHMVTNMANTKFWETDRYPVFGQTSDILMSGYKQHLNGLRFSLGYIFRYKNKKQ